MLFSTVVPFSGARGRSVYVDDGERRKSETLRAFDKLRTLLKTKEEDVIEEIENEDIQAIERRISDLEDKLVYTFPEKLDPACGVNIPKRNGASVSVYWDKVPRKDVYDVTVHCSQNGVVERTSVCGVEGSSYRVDNLRPDTCYRLTVAVHQDGEPFRLNGKMASEDTFISDGSRIMMPATAPQTCSWQKYSRISGTTGTLQVASGTQYWETKLEFSVPKSVFKGCCIFDVGICSKTAVDKITAFHKNYNSYSISIVKRENKFVRVECNYEGHDVVGEGENLVWDSQFKLHFGYYLDIKARTFSVINVTKNSILWTFNNIKSSVYYVPVFTHCNGQFKSQQPELLLITGEDITAIPSCIASLLDDHCILESSDNEESIVSIYEDEEDGFCFFPF
ncbi:hypothetical protein KUTeg_024779 [Tegillarca granosa]|uniref:Fibronectin type-III domain-containing protein n=1 Tax=Tegillarca granosa TaxID=220873 RepID=A0ABQ9DYE0_TEGGR|nr:hypothetical protein KUTeg_024779 [Tegillarca granosa]